MPRSRSLAVAMRLKPRTAATSVSSSGTGSTFSDRIVTSASCTSEGMRVSSSMRTRRPVPHGPVHRARHQRRLARPLGEQPGVVPAVAQRLLGGARRALHEQRRVAADGGGEVLADPRLGRARHAEQQQGPVGGQRGDGDLHEPAGTDVLRGDRRAVRQHAAEQVGDDRPRREVPVGRPRAVVVRPPAPPARRRTASSACGRNTSRHGSSSSIAGRVAARSARRWARPRARRGPVERPEHRGQRPRQLVAAHPGDEVDQHGAVRQRRTSRRRDRRRCACGGRTRSARRAGRRAPAARAARAASPSGSAGRWPGAAARSGWWSTSHGDQRTAERADQGPAGGVRRGGGAAARRARRAPAAIRRRRPRAATRPRGPATSATSGRHRAAAATGSIGRASGGGGASGGAGASGTSPARRTTVQALTAVEHAVRGATAAVSATTSASGPGGGSGGSRRSVPSSAAVTSSSQ